MRWLQLRTVIAIHRLQVVEHGGRNGIRDVGLLESAMARPVNRVNYESDSDLAAAAGCYAFGIIRNHPFIDGNKRTALVAAETFLRINGLRLDATQEEKYLIFIRLADGSLSEEGLVEWLREKIATGGR
jgi:death-on-curing protein